MERLILSFGSCVVCRACVWYILNAPAVHAQHGQTQWTPHLRSCEERDRFSQHTKPGSADAGASPPRTKENSRKSRTPNVSTHTRIYAKHNQNQLPSALNIKFNTDVVNNNCQDPPWWFSCPPVSQVSGLTSEISPARFFSQFSSIWPFLKFDYTHSSYVWFLAHQRGSFLAYSKILMYLISLLGSFLNDRHDLLQQDLVQFSTNSITACLQQCNSNFTPREGSQNMN